MDNPGGGSSCPLFPSWIGIWNVAFCGGGKTGGLREKALEQGWEPTTNSAHMVPGLGIEQVLGPLNKSCTW